ncbi:multicopper oxidase domain-containing protein [Candidatus Halocynthiibacter alkanivorans]|uniref:multicopper oxidase domain-containing protein n=1 Tax=Candidatus Halocynthiibacter alkanivorans TaxID=2267619 RepID=UPI000DF30B1E|nr:multicopper oxidase domain-containing protein [Candidatus Halocynthiibacter alkanivorans]
MIRFFVILGVISTVVVGWLTTVGVGPETQLPPSESLLVGFREKGFVPASLNLEENEAAEEGIFDVPAMDEMMLEAAMESMDMGGMDMSDGAAPMKLDGDSGSMNMAPDSGAMNMGSDSGSMNMAADSGAMNMGSDSGTMNMAADSGAMNMGSDSGSMNMAADSGAMNMGSDSGSMNMAADSGAMNMGSDSGTMNMAADSGAMTMGSDGGTMNMAADSGAMNMGSDSGTMNMAADSDSMSMGGESSGMNMAMGSEAMEMDDDDDEMAEPAGGLLITNDGAFDREINLTMTEWGFSEMTLDVNVGERIRFNVKNGGQIPHEFMFMNMALMEAVKYRATRADWSLFEHEALFEQALVLPGGDFTFVLEVQQAGTWMFMCMLPYHMQMGMMGQMSTPGMAMEM